MQKNLRQELEKRKIEIESWSEKILYVKDSDRIIAIAHISDYTEVDCINNEVVERVYSLQNVENQTIKLFDKYPMQKILCEEVESQYNRTNSSIIKIQQIFESV